MTRESGIMMRFGDRLSCSGAYVTELMRLLCFVASVAGAVSILGGCLTDTQGHSSTQTKPTLTLTWDANTDPSVAGYNLYCGEQPHIYSLRRRIDGRVTSAQVMVVQHETVYYCAVTAFDVDGRESPFSDEVSKVVH